LRAAQANLRSALIDHRGLTFYVAEHENIVKKPGFSSLLSSTRDQQRLLSREMPARDIDHLQSTTTLFNANGAEAVQRAPVFCTFHDVKRFADYSDHSCDSMGNTVGFSTSLAFRSGFAKLPPPATLRHQTALRNPRPRLRLLSPSGWLADNAGTEAFHSPRVTRVNLSLVLSGSGKQGFAGVSTLSRDAFLTSKTPIKVGDSSDALLTPSLAENFPSVACETTRKVALPLARNSAGSQKYLRTLERANYSSRDSSAAQFTCSRPEWTRHD